MWHIQLGNIYMNIASTADLTVKMPTFITFPVKQYLNFVDAQGEFKANVITK